MAYMEKRPSGIISLGGLALAAAGGVEIYYLVFGGGVDYLNDTFGLSIGVAREGQLVAVSAGVLLVGASIATGLFTRQIMAVSVAALIFVGYSTGFISFGKSAVSKPIAAKMSNQKATELVNKLKAEGWVIKTALTTDGEKWCQTGNNKVGEGLESQKEIAAAIRNCATGYTWTQPRTGA